MELLYADRSEHRHDRVLSALSCYFLGSAAECPSERREPDYREPDSTDHCTPYRWFHAGMDLHLITLALGEGHFSYFALAEGR